MTGGFFGVAINADANSKHEVLNVTEI